MVSDSVKVALRLPSDVVDVIDRQARRDGSSRSDVIRDVLSTVFSTAAVSAAVDLPVPVPEPERIPEVEALIRPDSAEVDAAVARHPAGKRRHDGHRTDSRSGGSCSGCRDCTGWRPIVVGGMRCKCGHPVRMH